MDDRVSIGAAAILLAAVAGCTDLTHNDDADPAALARTLAAGGPQGTLDVALALGCPADDETGNASDCERCRVKSALRAFRDGEVRSIIMSGGAAHNRFVEADAMGRLALARGLPEGALHYEPRTLTTWMNLRFSQRIMREHGMKTALVISTAAHLPRARRFVEWYGIPARYRACDLDMPPDSDGEWPGGAIVPRPSADPAR
jgi:uncharacterized SAM-binding protein YcdF (DUF218 family)